MKRVKLIKEIDNYYLIHNNDKILLDTTWKGLFRTPDCRAVVSGIKYLSNNSTTIILFEETFYPPNALAKFSYQLNKNTNKYDFENHKLKILEVVELLNDIEREYFIESVVRLVEWSNQETHWVHAHLMFEKKVVPELLKLLEEETNTGFGKSVVMRNLENTFVHDSSNLSVEKDVLRMKQIVEKGGRTIHVCCPNTINILNKALAISLSDIEFNVFVKCFHLHPLSGFSYNEFRIENKLKVNNPELIDKIVKTAELFNNPKLKNLFIKSIFTDAQIENEHEDWAPMLLEFNQSFEKRFEKIWKIGIINNVLDTNDFINEGQKLSILEESHVVGGAQTSKSHLKINNNFDNIPIMEIFNHFKSRLVEKRYLSESDLINYLEFAFEKMTVPENSFKILNAPTKQIIMKVFYEYYKNIAGKPHGKQRKYAALLGDYFEGYNTDNVRSNFNK